MQNAIIFSRKRSLLGLHAKKYKKYILYIFNSFYSLDSCNQSLKWSLLRIKKRLGNAQICLLWEFNSCGSPPGPL